MVLFGGVAAGLLALAVWVIFRAGTYDPVLLTSCTSKRDPNPFFPIPGIVIWAVASFLGGGVTARLRARLGGSR